MQTKEAKEPALPDIKKGVRAIVEKCSGSHTVTVKTAGSFVAQGYLVSQLAASGAFARWPLVVVCADAIAKVRVFEYALHWLKKTNPRNKRTPSAIALGVTPETLWRIAENKPLVLITDKNESERAPSVRAFKEQTVVLAQGAAMTKEALLARLSASGYALERLAAAPGSMASRGSIVDVFPPGAPKAIRVDFNDNVIESLRASSPIAEIAIIPCSLGATTHHAPLASHNERAKTLVLEPFPARPDVAVAFSGREVALLEELVAPKREKRIDASFIKNLAPGDYVVHLDHGVARFEGIVEQTIDTVTGEYFALAYAEGDKLFVPATLAEKIEKYVGEAHPALDRLGAGVWSRSLSSARLETLSEARELLAVQAERRLARVLPVPRNAETEAVLARSFPFSETQDQRAVIETVYHDLAGIKPMDRLVCGDVGFGKTEVAVRAAAAAALAGYQVAILSPTTILAQQHLDTIRERLSALPLSIEGLSRFQTSRDERAIVEKLSAGSVDIVVGTHRILSGDVRFKNLGLIIIDEEQRFGVRHKELLKKMRAQAHVLTLTATPIPRTLHLAYSGVRDISIIATPPSGRTPIETFIEPYDHARVTSAIRAECARNGQTYYLYNNVESMSLKKQELAKLVPEVRFGVLHGQLPEHEIAEVMHAFDTGELDVLVCSTIIENGLDLPNVNTLIVDNATQFGLSQLHQIRGRIGRGARQAYAYFFYKRQKLTGEAERRLAALEEARALGAGFDLAVRDMEIRGVGNVLGRAQHGHVKSIGLGLYLRLLANAVEEIASGVPATILADVSVDLPIEARIPGFFEPDKERRIERYHEWALIENPDELSDIKKQLETEGALPAALDNLFYILRLKLLARRAGITAIDTIGALAPGEAVITIRPLEPIAPARFGKLLQLAEGWEYSTEEIRIKKSGLGADWKRTLEKCLVSLGA
ncbi:MAG: DEAD/DEAH box helicase [Parcubacteria group bacterium]|nr:DEAD/DEAH box helicase [Parcubacteria group bacterium]